MGIAAAEAASKVTGCMDGLTQEVSECRPRGSRTEAAAVAAAAGADHAKASKKKIISNFHHSSLTGHRGERIRRQATASGRKQPSSEQQETEWFR
jgi:hypothetical protein